MLVGPKLSKLLIFVIDKICDQVSDAIVSLLVLDAAYFHRYLT